MVTSATRPRSVSTAASLNSVSGSEVLPDQRSAHAHPDAEGAEAVARIGPLPEAVRELGEQSHPGGRERVSAGDRAAVRVEPLVLRVDPEDERLNPYGGAIACGHPLAATGVRLLAQLAYGFRERPDVRYGLTALCVGMGMGAALVWENVAAGN